MAVTTTESWIQVFQGPEIQIRILFGLTCLQGMIDVRCIGRLATLLECFPHRSLMPDIPFIFLFLFFFPDIPFNRELSLALGCPGNSEVKNPPDNAGDSGSISVLERSRREGNSNPLQCSCLGNPMDGGDWRATVHGSTVLDTT